MDVYIYLYVLVLPLADSSFLDFKKVLHYSNPKYMAALQTQGDKVFNRFIVYSESIIVSYSLELLARLALSQTTPEALDASMEKMYGSESNIVFCKCLQMGGKALGKFSVPTLPSPF